MHRQVLSLLLSLASVSALELKTSCAAETGARRIIEAYHSADYAFARNDLKAYFAASSPSYVLIDPDGSTHSLVDERNIVKYLWRKDPNERRAWHEVTDVQSIAFNGDRALVRGHYLVQLVQIDNNGTVADVREVRQFEDRWKRTPTGWQSERCHVLSAKRTASGHPSPYVLEQIAHMREINNQIHTFNENVNESNCIYSPGKANMDYYERQQACSR